MRITVLPDCDQLVREIAQTGHTLPTFAAEAHLHVDTLRAILHGHVVGR